MYQCKRLDCGECGMINSIGSLDCVSPGQIVYRIVCFRNLCAYKANPGEGHKW